MDRRSFLRWGAAGGAALAASGAAYRQWREITPQVHYPGRAEGHFLRDRRVLPAPAKTVEADVVILGSGIAGLTAAWKLRREGHGNVLMIDGPQPYGNAAGGWFGELAFPTGGHYLPLPSPESVHVREILADVGIILRDAMGETPYYDERAILHGPEERLLFNGRWQDGFVPVDGVDAAELDEQRRFFAEVERLRQQRGADGRRVFVFPTEQSSRDPAWLALDRLTLKQWLVQQGYRAPTLHWYLDYCCRDDYGTGYDKVSAWAGLHYYCSRWGRAANAGNGAWLTWPGGLQQLATAMARSAAVARMAGTAVSLKHGKDGVTALCLRLDGQAPASYLVKARKAICAMPLHVAARVVDGIGGFGFDARAHMPEYAPWLVANFLMKDFPRERGELPLAWDNVVHRDLAQRAPGLGFVVSTHQDIRVRPPEKTVFTAYVALSDRQPLEARKWLQQASAQQLLELAAADLRTAYGRAFDDCVERADFTVRAHAMAAPLPGFRSNAGLQALRAQDGAVLFAHADLSGFSVFEEAAWWGYRAAQRV